jgi:hypothetical protein
MAQEVDNLVLGVRLGRHPGLAHVRRAPGGRTRRRERIGRRVGDATARACGSGASEARP